MSPKLSSHVIMINIKITLYVTLVSIYCLVFCLTSQTIIIWQTNTGRKNMFLLIYEKWEYRCSQLFDNAEHVLLQLHGQWFSNLSVLWVPTNFTIYYPTLLCYRIQCSRFKNFTIYNMTLLCNRMQFSRF